MTNYEKLISSIMLSAVLSKTYGIGCGCNCDCDEDTDSEIQIISTPAKIKYSKYNEEEIRISTYSYERDIETTTKLVKYRAFLKPIIEDRDKNALLRLYVFEKGTIDNLKLQISNDEGIDEFMEVNFHVIEQLYRQFKAQFQNVLSKNFSYDFCQINKEAIKNLDYSLQLSIVNLFIDLIAILQEENTTIENFSKACIYHGIKNRQEVFTKEYAPDFIISKKSPLKPIITGLRDQIFLSLFDYIMDYLNLCHLKFGEGFWIKEEKKQCCDLLGYLKAKSDEGRSIKNFFNKQKTLWSYDLYNHICDMSFSKITKIKEKLNVLPNFSDVFGKDKKVYKVKEDKIEEFKKYFNFLDEDTQTYIGHEKDINNFFSSLSKNYKTNETSDEELQGKIFKFSGLKAPEFTTPEKVVSKEDNEE